MKEEPRALSNEAFFSDFMSLMFRRKTMVCVITLSACIITLGFSFFIPPTYRAEVKILPPQMRHFDMYPQSSAMGGYSPDLQRTAAAVNAPNYIYLGMLRSRTILDRIIVSFDLMDHYGADYRQEARKVLAKALRAESGKYGLISVTVDDRDSVLAADMANAFIKEMKQLTKSIAVTEASRRRLFFEQEIEQTKEKLVHAEDSMRAFQEKTGAIKIEEQTQAVLESFSLLRAKVAAKEVDLKVLQTYTTQQNPDFQRAEEELKGLKEQLYLLEQRGGKNPDPLVPTGRIPTLETGYIRKLRDLKYYESLLELIGQQYEVARVDEARESVIIQILDDAIPPEKPIRPDRLLMSAVALGGGFVLSVFAIFLMEYVAILRRKAEAD